MTRAFTVLALAVLSLAGCATTTTSLEPVAPEEVEAEEAVQREIVLSELNAAQQRLDDLAFELLAVATPLCDAADVAPRFGLSYSTIHVHEGEWMEAARASLGLGDTATVTSVASGSPADRAGLREGDRLIALDGDPVPVGEDATDFVSEGLEASGAEPVRLEVLRASTAHELEMRPDRVCAFEPVVVVEGDINAFADGERMIFPWAMMRFANDDELRGVLAHEIAHNAMGHIDARQSNMIAAGIFGALLDVAAASQGVNTGGQNTANFMEAGARAFSQDFEREADYVGMYLLARAERPLETAPVFWRQFAQINPAAISYASTHPTTAERFVRLRNVMEEIEEKRRQGEDLLPEMESDQ